MIYVFSARVLLDVLASGALAYNGNFGWAWIFVGLGIADFATLCMFHG